MKGMKSPRFLTPLLSVLCLACSPASAKQPQTTANEHIAGQPADVAPSAYQYRADRKLTTRAEWCPENSPESWIALMKYAGLPFDKAVNPNDPNLRHVLCGLIWEEVRRVRRVELAWDRASHRKPKPDDVVLTYFNAEAPGTIPTWWNTTALREAAKPEVSADGLVYTFTIPGDTFGLVVAVRGPQNASAYDVPTVRAFVPDPWKKMDLEIEWGFDKTTAPLDYSGRIEAYDGVATAVRPIAGDAGTTMKGADKWQSAPGHSVQRGGRRGVNLSLLYVGTSRDRKPWPYNAAPEDAARTIVTLWTRAGSFSFLASDLEKGPILAPEFGFFVRNCARTQPAITPSTEPSFRLASDATTAKEFEKELGARGQQTIRQRVREHAEEDWDGAMAAMFPAATLPAIPKPAFAPPMKVEVPSQQLTAQWNLGAWHLARHAVKDVRGRLHFNDYPYGILAAETYLVLRTLDLMGMHEAAAEGLDQWLGLPMKNGKPVGLFSEGDGCLTNAAGPPGVGGNMDGIHGMGPGAIMYALAEHFALTGDDRWLKSNAPRMKANVQWILRQRQLLTGIIPGGDRLWCKGLQPPHQVTPDSGGQLMQFYESEAYYWLAVRRFADMMARIDAAEGRRLAAEAESYRKDLRAAVERSIALSPVVLVRDGTYRSFIPFACYVRGFASGAWSWRRPGSGAHVGGLYWDTIQSAEALVSPAGLLPPGDRRVQGALDVLEDRLLLENPKVAQRTPGYDPEKHWFAHAAWQYQPGLERHANIHLAAGDAPNFLRSWLNQYAVQILPAEGYTFREHTTGGPPDKIFEEAAFLERFRDMLVMEDGDNLWLGRATPRAWLENGKKIVVQGAPTHFGTVSYEIVSSAAGGKITARVTMPSRGGQKAVLLRFRHPSSAPMKRVEVNGQDWRQFDKDRELIRLEHLTGAVTVEAVY